MQMQSEKYPNEQIMKRDKELGRQNKREKMK